MIRIHNLNFRYTDGPFVLNDLNLEIAPGRCVLLCGESGGGKTTVTRLINGIIPHMTPGLGDTEEVAIQGQPVSGLKMYELAQRVGSVFQNPKSQFFHLDSDSELAFGLENEGLPPEQIRARVQETVEALGIRHLEHRSIFSMSGGEKQALAFASAYAMRPQILVLDEPSANLDAAAIETLQHQIAKAKDHGHTVVIAEHRLHYLAHLVDDVCYFRRGRLEHRWTGEEFRNLTETRRIELGLRSITGPSLRLGEAPASRPQGNLPDLLIEDLSFAYKTQAILHNIHLSAQKGDIIGITGPNGAGKTTFCLCLSGLLRGGIRESGGIVHWEGKPQPPRARQKLCALVMQDVNHQLFTDSVWEECELSARNASREEIERVLERFDLLDYRDAHPMTLSGGQKQRLAVAAAVLSRRQILIFDEPTSGLDYRHMMEVSALLQQLSADGHILFVVSHDVEFLNATCNRLLPLRPQPRA